MTENQLIFCDTAFRQTVELNEILKEFGGCAAIEFRGMAMEIEIRQMIFSKDAGKDFEFYKRNIFCLDEKPESEWAICHIVEYLDNELKYWKSKKAHQEI